jgi:hypothetical protein
LIDDNAANQNVGWVWNLFAVFLQVLEAKFDSFPDVCQRIFDCFSLRIAAGKRRTHDYITAIFIRLKEDFEIQASHIPMLHRVKHRGKHFAQKKKAGPMNWIGPALIEK